MIQVDVFWSFAMGASFAVAATEGLKKSDSMFYNKYFVYTVCFLSMIFAPSGIYLLWHFTGWETMFFLDRDLHGIWPCIFAHTNVSLGVSGFVVAYKMIKAGMELQAHALYTIAYTCMFSILTFGYDRFLYAGTQDEWNRGVKYQLQDFFQCDVFYALMVMSIFVLPPIYYAVTVWPVRYGMTAQKKKEILKAAIQPYVSLSLIIALGYAVLLKRPSQLFPETWGVDRLIAFAIGQVVFGSLLFLPLYLMRLRTPRIPKESKTKKN